MSWKPFYHDGVLTTPTCHSRTRTQSHQTQLLLRHLRKPPRRRKKCCVRYRCQGRSKSRDHWGHTFFMLVHMEGWLQVKLSGKGRGGGSEFLITWCGIQTHWFDLMYWRDQRNLIEQYPRNEFLVDKGVAGVALMLTKRSYFCNTERWWDICWNLASLWYKCSVQRPLIHCFLLIALEGGDILIEVQAPGIIICVYFPQWWRGIPFYGKRREVS